LKILGRKWIAAVALVAVATACDDNGFEVIEELTFDPSLSIDLAAMQRLDSGVYIQDLVVGTGDVVVLGSQVTVTYTGWLANGTQFDAGTFPFTAGVGQVIDGFDIGVLGMQVGGTRRIVIPPELAYGSQERASIPAGSVLVFDITVDESVSP